jgi:hypothetical protein
MRKSSIIFIILLILLSIPLFSLIGISLKADEITPNDEFFTLSISSIPQIEVRTWRLAVTGMVDNQLYLTYDNITSLPHKSKVATLKCVEGPSGTADWRGVKLKSILDQAGVQENAKEVVFFGADGYSSSLTIEDALQDDVLLAYEMNGKTLPSEHGFPLKLVVPGKAGYKWVKWIERVEVIDYDYKGYWESAGWDDDADLGTLSEWGLHAYFLSIGFIFGGLATISGYRTKGYGRSSCELPKFINRRFHVITSVIYLLILFLIFTYWVYTTLDLRGNIFYSGHGKLSLMVLILTIAGGITGLKKLQKYYLIPEIHRNTSLFGFILYAGVIFMGLVLAY